MAKSSDKDTPTPVKKYPPLRLARVISARRETVFAAWGSADHVRHWFAPESYTIPEARVEMRVGGAFDVCMRSPTGQDFWTRGVFVEVTPHSRLVIDLQAVDEEGQALFHALTEVNFCDVSEGTEMQVVQTYAVLDPVRAAQMIGGAPEGWRTTLDRLERQVARMALSR